MKYSKTKGFSLAELLISLLVISLVLAAAIPTITKRNAAGGEKIWHWTSSNNSAYFGVGSNQSAILGAAQEPFREEIQSGNYISNFFSDADIFTSDDDRSAAASHFTTSGDKLVILKRQASDMVDGAAVGRSTFMNSHLSFYNIENKSDATPNDIVYGGRLTLDKHNIALGIGSLQTLSPDVTGYNTAIGHYALLFNSTGLYNSAVGEKALTYNKVGNNNSAFGYSALNALSSEDHDGEDAVGNTAVGSFALGNYTASAYNTAVGDHALYSSNEDTPEGKYNTAVGSESCSARGGNYNVCLGYRAGSSTFVNNVDYNYALNIGIVRDPEDTSINEEGTYPTTYDTPIITGVMQKYVQNNTSTTYDKELNINTRIFNIKTFDGSRPVFYVQASNIAQDNNSGYAVGEGTGAIGDFFFNLRDFGQNGNSIGLALGGYAEGSDRQVIINAYDRYNDTTDATFADFTINNILKLDFDATSGRSVKLSTAYQNTSNNTAYAPLKLNNIAESTSDSAGGEVFRILKSDGNAALSYSATDDIIKIDTKNIDFYATDENAYIGAAGKVQLHSESGEIEAYGTLYVTEGSSWDSAKVTIEPSKITLGNTTVESNQVSVNGTVITSSEVKIGGSFNVKQEITNLQSQLSDARAKNISGDNTAGLKEVNALEVKNYTYKNDEKKVPHVGVIAQQLKKVFPNSVFKGEDGYLRIRTEEIFYAMVNSIKELFAQLQDLTAKVTGLDKRITELETQNQLLKKQNEEFEKRLAKLEKKAAE